MTKIKSLTILYIGKFSLSYSTENYVTYALEQLGHTVIKQPYDQVGSDFRTICNIIHDCNPDVILFSKPQASYTSELLSFCRSLNLLTVCWQWDLFFGYRRNHPLQFKVDLLFTTDGGHPEEFRKRGYNHRVLRQGIHEPDAVKVPCKLVQDIVFIGGRKGHGTRPRLLRWLQTTYGSRFKHHTDLRGMQLNEELGKTKIVVGDSYPSPNYWSNRIYEITGRGGFLLHPITSGLNTEFTHMEHYVGYEKENFQDLRSKIDYFLENDKERERIRLAGYNRTTGSYTYTQRVKVLLGHIEQELLARSK